MTSEVDCRPKPTPLVVATEEQLEMARAQQLARDWNRECRAEERRWVPWTGQTQPTGPKQPWNQRVMAQSRDALRWQTFCEFAPGLLGSEWERTQRRIEEIIDERG